MNITKADQSKEGEITPYGEMVRLGNEFRNHPDIFPNADDPKLKHMKIPAKTDGFDFETCMESDLKKWLSKKIKKSNSQISFLNRVYAWRFNDSYGKQSPKLLGINKLEKDLINSLLVREHEHLGIGVTDKIFHSKGRVR
jgi:hypothetical protein